MSGIGDVPGGPREGAGGGSTYRRMMIALLAAGFATFAQLYALQAMLPELARDLGATPAQAALSISTATAGLALMVLVWTVIARRIGRLRAMQWAAVSSGVLSVATAWAPTLQSLLVARLVTGALLGGVPALAIAYVHEHLDTAAALSASAAYISGTAVGGASGRLLAGPLAQPWGWRVASAVVAAIGLLAVVVFVALAPRTSTPPAPRVATDVSWGTGMRAALTDRGLLVLYLQAFLLMGVMVSVYNYTGFRLEAPPFLIAPAVASLVFLAYFGGTAASRVAGYWMQRVGPRRVAVVSIVAMALGLLVMLPDRLVAVVVGIAIFTAGFFSAHAVCAAWVGARASVAARSQAGALYTIAYYAGSAVIGWGSGFLYLDHGWGALDLVLLALVLLSGLWLLASRGLRGAGPATA